VLTGFEVMVLVFVASVFMECVSATPQEVLSDEGASGPLVDASGCWEGKILTIVMSAIVVG